MPDYDVPMPDAVIGTLASPVTAMEMLATRGNARTYLLFLLREQNEQGTRVNRATQWNFAETAYNRLKLAFGEPAILDAAERVRTGEEAHDQQHGHESGRHWRHAQRADRGAGGHSRAQGSRRVREMRADVQRQPRRAGGRGQRLPDIRRRAQRENRPRRGETYCRGQTDTLFYSGEKDRLLNEMSHPTTPTRCSARRRTRQPIWRGAISRPEQRPRMWI